MGIRRLPLFAVLLATLAAPAMAQRFVSPDRAGDDYYLRSPDRERGDAAVVLSGSVVSVDRDRQSLRLRTRRGVRTVELYDGTRLLDDAGRVARLRDFHAGDELQVRGVDRNGRIVADRVTLLGPGPVDEAREEALAPRDRVVLVGTVRTPTYDVSRKVKVRTTEGDITVAADPRTPITAYGDRISIHELERGDRVRVAGEWTGSDRLQADRIDVLPPREAALGYRSSLPAEPASTFLGELVSFDHNRDRLRLSTRDGDRIILAQGVPAYLRGERISRGDLRPGDRVRVTGYWNGHEMLATRLDLAY